MTVGIATLHPTENLDCNDVARMQRSGIWDKRDATYSRTTSHPAVEKQFAACGLHPGYLV